jgi:ABC-type phosphate transport system substrate-binding protein
MMTRNFKESEAATTNGYDYDCVGSDRNVIQIETATQGLTVAVKKGGIAEQCIGKLGGLTIDQLRWMFSNFVEVQLRESGWSDEAVPNNDGNPNTKYWGELMNDPACAAVQISIAGPDSLSL